VADKTSRTQIVRLAFLLASVLIILASASLLIVGRFASRQADIQAVQNQQSLLETALDGRFILMARDQLSLARWDESVRKISLKLDEDFVTDEFIDSLWYDFGIDRNLLIGPDDTILADCRKAEVAFDTGKLAAQDPLHRFVQLARTQYFTNRISLDGGFGQRLVPLGEEFVNPVHGFVELDGQVALVHSMAVVPDDGAVVLPDGNPVILLSAQYLDADLVKELSYQLGFSQMQFERGAPVQLSLKRYTLVSAEGKKLGHFSWKTELPGGHIWSTVIPVVIILGSLLGAVALITAWRIGKLTVSLAKSEEQNYYLAMHDTLSGLANRLQFTRALEVALARLPEVPFSLMQCDLDKFKHVNDTYGHGAGDEVIKVVGSRLTDCVQDAGLVCRIGGDEFVILLDSVERKWIEQLAARIIEEVHKPIEVEPKLFAGVGISLGIAGAPTHGTTSAAIMSAADAALYYAKENGRNMAVFYEDLPAPPANSG